MSTFMQCDAPVRGDKIRESSNQSQLQFYGAVDVFYTSAKTICRKRLQKLSCL